MATVANLMVNFSTNVASMVTDFEKTSSSVKKAASEITSTLGLLTGAFAGMITLASLKMGEDWVAQQMDVVEANKKTADSLDISYGALVKMQMVARESGVETEALTGSLDKMQKTLYSAAAGSAKQADVFKQLGLSIKDLMAMTPDQQFNKIAGAISQLANPTERMGIAMMIFGKSAGQMVNIFNDYNKKSEEAAAFTEKFGLKLSDIDAQKVVQANEALMMVHQASAGLADTIAARLSPLIEAMSKDWLDSASSAEQWGSRTDVSVNGIVYMLDSAIIAYQKLTDIAEISATAMESGAIAFKDVMTGNIAAAKAELQSGHQIVSQLKKDYDDASNSAGHYAEQIAKAGAAAAAAAKNHNGNKNLTNMNGADGTADMNAAIERQKSLLKSIVGPALTLQQTMTDLNALYDAGKISALQYGEAMDKLQLEMAKTDKTMAGGFKTGMLEVKAQFSDLNTMTAKTVTDGFKNAEDAIVNFAETGKISVKGMVTSMIDDLMRLQVRQSITGPLFSALSGAMSGASSGGGMGSFMSTAASSIAKMLHFAKGGSFQVGGGGGTDSKLVQFMASPDETVTVTNPGQAVSSGGGVTVIQNISIGAGVQGTVIAEIRKIMPDLKKQAIAGVAEAQMRGMM